MIDAPLGVKVDKAAAMTGVGRDRILRAVREGEVDVVYPFQSGRYLIVVESLQKWFRGLPDEPPGT